MKTSIIRTLAALALGASVSATATEVRLAKQLQINNLPTMVVEQQKLFEKHAAVLGQPELQAKWVTFANGSATTDALISGNVDFVSAGITNFAILWARTKGNVRGVAGVAGLPLKLLTRNPDVHALGDFSATDRIAVPTVKVSNQAVLLAYALQQEFGQPGRLDEQTVQLAHADAVQAILNPRHEVNSYFSTPPYTQRALADDKVHVVLNSADLFPGDFVNNVIFTTSAYHDRNPVAVQALIAALDEANEFINGNKRAAAELYLQLSGERLSADEVLAVLEDRGAVFSATPQGSLPIVQFMHETGLIPQGTDDWKTLYFPEITQRPGS